MSKIHAELNNQSLNGTSSQEITRTTVGTKNGLHIYDISAKAPTAFGENISEGKSVKLNASATYNLIPANFREFTTLSGTTGAEDNEFKVTTGTTQFGYGAIQSFRSLNFQYDSSAGVRFGARFPDTNTLTWQGVGLAGIGDEISFGRGDAEGNGDFGVWHRYGGKAEVRTIEITTASTGATDLTLTLNDVEYTIPLTNATAQVNAHEIAAFLTANASELDAFQNDDTVTISYLSDGAKTGAFTFSHATAEATITQLTAGLTKTSDFVSQEDWNGDTPVGFDPTKGNQYQITYSAGYGNINYYIFDFNNSEWMLCHTVRWQNSSSVVNLTNPKLRTIIYVASIGSTTDTAVYCPFISGFVFGPEAPTRNPRSYNITKSVGTTEIPLFQLRNRKVYNGLQNQAEILPQRLVVANEGAKNVTIAIYGNATVTGNSNFQDVGTNLIAEVDSSATGYTAGTGRPLDKFTVAPGSNEKINLTNIVIPPTLRFVVTADKASGGSSADVTATISWIEDL